MPALTLMVIRVDNEDSPDVWQTITRSVDWSQVPRISERVAVWRGWEKDFEALVIDVCYEPDGRIAIDLGRPVLEDLDVEHLEQLGWQVLTLPGEPMM